MLASATLIARLVENFMLLVLLRAKRRGEKVDRIFAWDTCVMDGCESRISRDLDLYFIMFNSSSS